MVGFEPNLNRRCFLCTRPDPEARCKVGGPDNPCFVWEICANRPNRPTESNHSRFGRDGGARLRDRMQTTQLQELRAILSLRERTCNFPPHLQ